MAEPERKCATCKFYEPAPIWRKGWCRNPLLYAPQQSHLVAEDDLDCSRGLSDYWEAADGTGPNAGVNIAASSSGRDFFGRGSTGSTDTGATDAADNPWNTGNYGSSDSYGTGSGYNSGYSSVGRAIPPVEDDGYAPQEPTSSRPSAQPRYLGSVGDEDDANEVRNPWDNSQRGYGTPPTQSNESDRYGSGTGYGHTGYDATEQEQRGYDDERERGYGAENDRGYGQTGAYGTSSYGTTEADNGYDQGAYSQNGYAQGGYGAEGDRGGYGGYGQSQEYGAQGGYGQGGYGAEPGGYGQGGYGNQGGYGQNGAYDPSGYGAPTSPPPAVSGTRAPAAGATGGRRVTAAPQGRERALTYYTEERYWTDYAKLAVPVVVVIALLGAIWFIGTGKIGRGGGATSTPNSATIAAGGTSPTGAAGARGTGPALAGSAGAGTPRAAGTPGAMTGVGTMNTPGVLPSVLVPTPAGAMASPATTGMTPAGMPVMSVQFKVANTGGSGANMRADASTTAAVVTVVPEGSLVQQIGSPMMAGDGLWYKVQFGDKTGWIRNDFLVAA